MGELITAYHGTRVLERIISTKAILCVTLATAFGNLENYLVNEPFYNSRRGFYEQMVKELVEMAEKKRVFGQSEKYYRELINGAKELGYDEAIADMFAKHVHNPENMNRRSEYEELKRVLFVYLANRFEAARNYARFERTEDLSAAGLEGVIELSLPKEIIRKGELFYRNDFTFIEVPKMVPAEYWKKIHVFEPGLKRTRALLRYNQLKVKVVEME